MHNSDRSTDLWIEVLKATSFPGPKQSSRNLNRRPIIGEGVMVLVSRLVLKADSHWANKFVQSEFLDANAQKTCAEAFSEDSPRKLL